MPLGACLTGWNGTRTDAAQNRRYNSRMNAPMFGNWSVEVKEVRPFAIHGDQYYELHVVRPEDRDAVISLKVPQHALKVGVPNPGDRLTVSFLAGQVTSAKPASK